MNQTPTPAGWYRDPTAQSDGRYWNGTSWTDSVTRGGVTVSVPIDAATAQVPPVPGSALQAPPPATAPPPQEAPSSRSPVGMILGVLVAIAIAVALFALLNDSDSSDPAPDPGAPATAPPATDPPATDPPATDPPATDGA